MLLQSLFWSCGAFKFQIWDQNHFHSFIGQGIFSTRHSLSRKRSIPIISLLHQQFSVDALHSLFPPVQTFTSRTRYAIYGIKLSLFPLCFYCTVEFSLSFYHKLLYWGTYSRVDAFLYSTIFIHPPYPHIVQFLPFFLRFVLHILLCKSLPWVALAKFILDVF